VSDSSIVLPDSTTTLVVDMTTNNEEELTISSSFSNHTSPTINRPSSTSVSIVLVAKQTPEKKEHPTIIKVPAMKNVSSPSPVPIKPKQTIVPEVELEHSIVTNRFVLFLSFVISEFAININPFLCLILVE